MSNQIKSRELLMPSDVFFRGETDVEKQEQNKIALLKQSGLDAGFLRTKVGGFWRHAGRMN